MNRTPHVLYSSSGSRKGAWLLSLFVSLAGVSFAQNPIPFINQRLLRMNAARRGPGLTFSINGTGAQAHPKPQTKGPESYGKLPLSFEANNGQTDARVKFLSRVRGYTLFLTQDEAVLALDEKVDTRKAKIEAVGHVPRPGRPELKPVGVLRMKLRNANPTAKVTGLDELSGTSNYFIGNDSAKWRRSVVNYAKVQYKDIYSGIDLVYHGSQRQLEYDFVVAPGADPRRIAFDVGGAQQILRDGRGDMVFKIGQREIRWHKPFVYQKEREGSAPREIAADYAITGKNRVGFELEKYDRTKPLYIDPVIYSTYLGGTNTDVGSSIAVDNSGNVYVTGYTQSTDFPTTTGAFQTTMSGIEVAFVTKINATGTGLVYSTYLGGSNQDGGAGIAVDSVGDAFVTGFANSTDFPTTPGAYQTTGNGSDAFVTKIDPTGSALLYSTYLGGITGYAQGFGIALDSAGDAYVTGFTSPQPHAADDFPTTPGAFQTGCTGTGCDFVTEVNATGTALVYSTYLGVGMYVGSGIAVDSSGSAYITGGTPNGFPTTPGAFQTTMNGLAAAFVTKLNATGAALVYSTYLGNNYTGGSAITVDSSGNAYVTGSGGSDFPTTPGAFQTACNGDYQCTNAFVTKLNPAGSGLVYSTFVGGNDGDRGSSIAVDSSGDAFVVGTTASGNFPTTPGALQTTFDGVSDAFVTEINPAGSALYYSTFLGGTAADLGRGIAVDSSHNAYVTGQTNSADFPTSTGAFQTTCTGGGGCSTYSDAFVTMINFDPSVAVNFVPASVSFGPEAVGSTTTQSFTLASVGIELPLSIISMQVTGPNSAEFAEMNNCPTSLASGGNCTITVTFTPAGGGTRTAAVAITDDAPNSPQTIPLTGVGLQAAVSVSPATVSFPAQYVGTSGLPQTLIVTNTGTAALTVTSVTTSIADFGTLSNCTNTVPPNSNCTIGVFFDPTASGTRTGTLLLTDDASGSPQSVTLSGTGQDFSVAPSGSSTATISPGQTATYTVAVAPAGGFNQPVALSCSGAPAQSTCSLSSNSVNLNGSSSTTVKVTVATAGSSARLANPFPILPSSGNGLAVWLTACGIPGLVLVGIWGSSQKSCGGARYALMLLCLLSAGAGLSACGSSGSTTSGGGGGTPAGTYTILVNGTFSSNATSLTHTTKLTLVVQ